MSDAPDESERSPMRRGRGNTGRTPPALRTALLIGPLVVVVLLIGVLVAAFLLLPVATFRGCQP